RRRARLPVLAVHGAGSRHARRRWFRRRVAGRIRRPGWRWLRPRRWFRGWLWRWPGWRVRRRRRLGAMVTHAHPATPGHAVLAAALALSGAGAEADRRPHRRARAAPPRRAAV